MMNFNGQLKKRSVNLGGGFKQNRNQLLLNSQKERERRERDRLKEKSIQSIQRSVKRYLQFIKFKYVLSGSWGTLSTDPNSLIFQFNLFYPFIFKHNDKRLSQLKSFLEIFSSTGLPSIRLFNIQGTYETAVNSLKSLSVSSEADVETLSLLLELLKITFTSDSTYRSPCIPILSQILMTKLSVPQPIKTQIIEVVSLYSEKELSAYMKFMADFKDSSSIEINFKSLTACKDSLIEGSFSLKLDERLRFLQLIIEQTPIELLDSVRLTLITAVLTTLNNVTLLTHQEKIQNSNDTSFENEAGEEESDPSDIQSEHLIEENVNQSLKQFYSRDFIAKSASILENDINVSSQLYSALLTIKPSWKSNILVFLIPHSFETYVDYILSNQHFTAYSSISEDKILSLSQSDLLHYFQADPTIKRFLTTELYTFLEIFQFQLIISNDFELFLNYGFSTEKFKELSVFLKKFVLNLMWNESKISKIEGQSEYKKLFSVITKVLKQVYLKNTRMKILQPEEWLIDSKSFDLNNLVKVIQEYEIRKVTFEDDEEEEGTDTEKQRFMNSLNSDNRSKLNIFLKAPFFVSFSKRVEIFQNLIELDQTRVLSTSHNAMSNVFNPFSNFMSQKQTATIRREHLLEDAYHNFNKIGENFKHQLGIVFVNENGQEQGIDGGGLTKEFLTSVVNEGFHNAELFSENANHELYPNSQISLKYQYRIDSEEQLKKLEYIKFLGKVVGKCLYERVLIDINFSKFFLTKLNNNFQNSFDDLKSFDSELYQNLVKLLQMSSEDLDSLNLTFTTDERLDTGRVISIDLIPKGSLTKVTTLNRLKFIHEISNFKLNRVINLQTNAFLTGLYTIIDKHWLHMFNPYELQELIAGENDVNMEDLEQHTVYGGYETEDLTIKFFWEVLKEMETSDKLKFVKFVTSVPRAPLLGFNALVPKFGIRHSMEIQNLPTASTCVNLLILPDYQDKGVLREKLLYAINAEAGFDLD